MKLKINFALFIPQPIRFPKFNLHCNYERKRHIKIALLFQTETFLINPK